MIRGLAFLFGVLTALGGCVFASIGAWVIIAGADYPDVRMHALQQAGLGCAIALVGVVVAFFAVASIN